MKVLFAAALALAAQPALAQAERPTMQDLLAEMTGREVTIAGRIYRNSRGYNLHAEFGGLPVDFAVDRETLERLRGCPRDIASQLCRITAVGLLWFDGGQPNLTLSDVVFTD
jgi:hypothetical protein